MKRLAYFLAFVLVVCAALVEPPSAVAGPAGEVPSDLTPSGPVSCSGNEDLVLRGLRISTDANGVDAASNCDVLIVNCYIEAGGVGVLARGNAGVKIRDSFVSGSRGGLVAENRGEIRFAGSTIRGGTRIRNLGEIIDEGDNDLSGRATAPPQRPSAGGDVSVETGPGKVRISAEGDTVVVGEDSVEVGSEGVRITPEGVFMEDGSSVEVGARGVRVTTGGETVLVEDDYVRISEAGRVTEISGDWRASRSRYSPTDTQRLMEELGATVEGGTLQMQLAGDVLFGFDSTAIRDDAARELAKVAHLVRDRSMGTVYVIGHSDSIGDVSYNQKLSESRALAVMRWLGEHEGIPAGLMAGKGMGETNPIAHNTMPDGSDSPEGRSRNRRVEIKFEVEDR